MVTSFDPFLLFLERHRNSRLLDLRRVVEIMKWKGIWGCWEPRRRGNRRQGKSDGGEGNQDLCVKADVDGWKIKNDCPACVYVRTAIIQGVKNQAREVVFESITRDNDLAHALCSSYQLLCPALVSVLEPSDTRSIQLQEAR
jgi:hypothetical protein